jgi:predicted SAM-dependent methyltransferase
MNEPPTKHTALNIGSGARTGSPTFLYADAKAWPVDVRAMLPGLPFRDGAFEYVQCSHLIEHIDLEQVPAALADLRRVMMPKGILYISAPDMERASAVESVQWTHYTVKGGVPDGWEHRWTSDVRTLRALLVGAGLVPTWTTKVPQGWSANTHGWPVDFEARFLCRRDDWPWPVAFPQAFEAETIK